MKYPSSLNSHLLQQIAERSIAAFFIYNLQTKQFDYLNQAFEEIWEQSAEQINKSIPALISMVSAQDIPLLQKAYERLLSNSLRENVELRILIKGREKWINLTAFTILEAEKRVYLTGFADDISHIKENEIMANKFASHKDAILEMLSHDLGGPLGIALKLAEQIKQQSKGDGQGEFQEKAILIYQTLKQSIHLIDQYLEMEYLESAKTAIRTQRIELIEQLQFMLDGFKRMDTEGKKNYQLESSSPQIFVEVDQTKLQQIFSNLISNANKFTHPGSHITVRVQEQEQTLLIAVSDDGIGIPAALQPDLFERFTTARRPGLRGEETVGLGLSIVKRLVEMHQGRIWAESEENKGTTFFVEIPYVQPSPELNAWKVEK